MRKILFFVVPGLLFLNIYCKKDKRQDNPPKEEFVGPYTIYGEATCANNSSPVLVADYTYGHDIVKTTHTSIIENPEFWIRKTTTGEFIVFVITKYVNDTTFWVWYEPDDVTNCSFAASGCGSIKLEAFTDLNSVNANKYKYKFNPDNPNGTLITSPGGKTLFAGEGKQRSTGACNRLVVAFFANSAPCKELFEGDKPWDYCFSSLWFFRKKP